MKKRSETSLKLTNIIHDALFYAESSFLYQINWFFIRFGARDTKPMSSEVEL